MKLHHKLKIVNNIIGSLQEINDCCIREFSNNWLFVHVHMHVR